MSDTTIYIPTRGRVDQQSTANFLAGTDLDLLGRVILVCGPEEADDLRAAGHRVLVSPVEGHMGEKRQWILDQHNEIAHGSYIMLMDDDLVFAERVPPARFSTITAPDDLNVLLGRLQRMVRWTPVVGLANRSGANRLPVPVVLNSRMYGVQCLDVVTLRICGIQFRLPLMEDFDLSLQALTKGFSTATLTTHCKDDVGGSNAPGGCSLTRTPGLQRQAALDLWDLWPDFVAVVERPGWQGMDDKRYDVRISWAKAHAAGVTSRMMSGVRREPERDWMSIAPEWAIL